MVQLQATIVLGRTGFLRRARLDAVPAGRETKEQGDNAVSSYHANCPQFLSLFFSEEGGIVETGVGVAVSHDPVETLLARNEAPAASQLANQPASHNGGVGTNSACCSWSVAR